MGSEARRPDTKYGVDEESELQFQLLCPVALVEEVPEDLHQFGYVHWFRQIRGGAGYLTRSMTRGEAPGVATWKPRIRTALGGGGVRNVPVRFAEVQA
jgi:hypothetical protein